jgi:hypothetical protein
MSVFKTTQLGTLYQNGVAVDYSKSPVSYVSNAILELKSSSTNSNEIIEFLMIDDGAKQYLLSTKNILNNISYSQLNIQALVSGNTLVTLNSTKYKIRLITSDEWNKYILNQVNLSTLLTPTLLDMTVNGYDETTINSSETNNLLHWFKTPTLTQALDSNNIIIRGGESIDSSNSIDKSTLSNYRIMLEVYNNPPTISDSDRMLGNFSANFSKSYSVVDPDNDLFTIVTKIDDIVIQTLTNQVSKTDFSINLENQWNSLSDGQHIIYINVTDSYGNLVQRKWTFNKLSSDVGTSNALVRPQIVTDTSSSSRMYPIDGRNDCAFNFTAVGGELVIAHEFSIVDNETQNEIYKRKVTSFDFVHTVPSNSMKNGRVYQLKVRTYNQQGQYSNWSDTVLIRALTPPELIINTIVNDRIETGNPYFTATATFILGEGDGVYSYEYNLYKDGSLIATSDEIKDDKLSYQFNNLENKANYTISLVVKTNYEMTITLNQDFYCNYLQARLPAIMELENDDKNGSVDINTYVRQIIGRVESGDDIYYIDGDWAYLHNTVLIYDKDGAFRLQGNFTAKIWARDLEDYGAMLIQFNLDDDSKIILTRNGNVFTLSKIVSNIKLYELHCIIQGEILPTDAFYFFIQNNVDVGLMNFDVKRATDGRLTWFTATNADDIAPNYQTEDGFLTYINSKLLNNILTKSIDNQDSKIYLPSIDDFNLDIFKPILPSEDTENDYNILKSDIVFGIIGDTAIIGQTRLFDSSYLPYSKIGSSYINNSTIFDNSTACNILTRNLYNGQESFKIKYKVHTLDMGNTTISEKLDGLAFNFRKNIIDDVDYIIDLSSIWNKLSIGLHTIKICVMNGNYLTSKTLTFVKAYNTYGIDFSGNKIKIVTRSIYETDNTKLLAIDENGLEVSILPCDVIGIRPMFELPLTTKISLYSDLYDSCYAITTLLSPLYKTQTINNLNVGDKIKEYSTRYDGKLLKFTIINKLDDRVVLMCDESICEKYYDAPESTLINGNSNWNLSNIRQWLNNNTKIG